MSLTFIDVRGSTGASCNPHASTAGHTLKSLFSPPCILQDPTAASIIASETSNEMDQDGGREGVNHKASRPRQIRMTAMTRSMYSKKVGPLTKRSQRIALDMNHVWSLRVGAAA